MYPPPHCEFACARHQCGNARHAGGHSLRSCRNSLRAGLPAEDHKALRAGIVAARVDLQSRPSNARRASASVPDLASSSKGVQFAGHLLIASVFGQMLLNVSTTVQLGSAREGEGLSPGGGQACPEQVIRNGPPRELHRARAVPLLLVLGRSTVAPLLRQLPGLRLLRRPRHLPLCGQLTSPVLRISHGLLSHVLPKKPREQHRAMPKGGATHTQPMVRAA